jgi:hypothetical protein
MLSYAGARNQVRRRSGHRRYVNDNFRQGTSNDTNAAARDLIARPGKFWSGCLMIETRRVRRVAVAFVGRLVSTALAAGVCASAARADPPALMDSQSIVRSLAPSAPVHTRGLSIEPRAGAGASTAGGEHKIALDIRFGNDSNQLSPAAHAQLDELGTALASAELAHARFRIAGHTSGSSPRRAPGRCATT